MCVRAAVSHDRAAVRGGAGVLWCLLWMLVWHLGRWKTAGALGPVSRGEAESLTLSAPSISSRLQCCSSNTKRRVALPSRKRSAMPADPCDTCRPAVINFARSLHAYFQELYRKPASLNHQGAFCCVFSSWSSRYFCKVLAHLLSCCLRTRGEVQPHSWAHLLPGKQHLSSQLCPSLAEETICLGP